MCVGISTRKRNTTKMDTNGSDVTSEMDGASPRKRPCLEHDSWRRQCRRTSWRAVVLDLDETTGNWGLASLAYKMFVHFAGDQPPVELFVKHYLEIGGARPHLKQMLQTLEQWKRDDRIDEVAVFTSASNAQGWVSYLVRCMEHYAGTGELIGRRIVREDAPLASSAKGTRTIKDLSIISPDRDSVVLVDDKPEYVLNGYVIGVPEYSQDVSIQALEEQMLKLLPEYSQDIQAVFAADREQYPPNNVDFTGDDALLNCLNVLTEIFAEPKQHQSIDFLDCSRTVSNESVSNQHSPGSNVLTHCRTEHSLRSSGRASEAWGCGPVEC